MTECDRTMIFKKYCCDVGIEIGAFCVLRFALEFIHIIVLKMCGLSAFEASLIFLSVIILSVIIVSFFKSIVRCRCKKDKQDEDNMRFVSAVFLFLSVLYIFSYID